MGLSTSQLRSAWAPACNSGGFVTIDLYGDGRVTVDPRVRDAVMRLDDILEKWGYWTRSADTGAYNCRQITGGSDYSLHAYGIALDINWQTNPYGPTLITDMPRGMVDEIIGLRTGNGCRVWEWGGDWSNNKDAMHYEIDCSPADLATGIQGGGYQEPPKIGKDQMFAIIRYPNGACYRWNGINRIPIPNPTMLGGDQIMLSVLGMNAEVWNIDPDWANTFPEAVNDRLYWNSVVTAQEVGVPQDAIA